MQLYERGIRRRLAPMLNGDRRLIELAYSLLFTLPGTPVLRYGDEIGMGDDLKLPERNCARTPMQWSAEPQGGFTTADKPILPVISEGPYSYQHVNTAEQRRDPKSLLNWTERIVRMRKEIPEVGWGEFEVLPMRSPAVLAIRYDWRNNSVVFLHNLSDSPREVTFSTGVRGSGRPGAGESAERQPQLRGQGRQASPAPRGVRISLVPGRRPRLLAQAQRDRDTRAGLSGDRRWIGSPWWQTAVMYQIYPRSFQDGDGNGVGDLRGIRQRLPYLSELGVDAIWISPIFPSPMADFGYDISDYTGIDPLFGSLEEFDALLAAAHAHGLKVLLDLVPNHTSDQHPWFQESRSSRQSARRDWYIWRDPAPDGGPPNNWLSEFGGGAWQWDERTGQYYYHAFLAAQPDLNWRNPAVREAIHERHALLAPSRGGRVPRGRHLASAQGRPVPRQPAEPRLSAGPAAASCRGPALYDGPARGARGHRGAPARA